jgi:hypothetical protein
MQKLIQVYDATAGAAYLAANSDIDLCFYLVPYAPTIDDKVQLGLENQGYPPQRVYVRRTA